MAAKSKNKTRTFRLNNMTGLLNSESEENNYLTFDPNANYGAGVAQIPFEFRLIENWMPINRGGLSITFGYTEFFDTSVAAKITGLTRYSKSDGTSLFIFSQADKVYKLVAGVKTDIGATVTTSEYLDFTVAKDKLIICDGTLAPITYDGTTVGSLTLAPARLRQTIFAQNRLWGFGAASPDGSLLYYSDADTLDNMSNNFVNCNANDGQVITCISEFFIPGQLEPVIIVGKTKSVGIIVGDGSVDNPYTFVKINLDVGIPGFRQITQNQQDAYFFTPRGVSSYMTAVKNINIEQQLISGKIANLFTALQSTYLKDILCWTDWKNRRVSFAVCEGASTVPNVIYHYDVEIGGWYKQTGFDVTAAFTDDDGFVYTGDADGKINKQDPETFSYAGQPISATIATPYLDFFEPRGYKRIQDAKITIRGNGVYSLGLSCDLNYGTASGSIHNIPASGGVYLWGGGVWTDDPSVYQWGASPLSRKKFFPSGIFENISFTLTNSGVDQPVDLLEIVFQVEYLNLT